MKKPFTTTILLANRGISMQRPYKLICASQFKSLLSTLLLLPLLVVSHLTHAQNTGKPPILIVSAVTPQTPEDQSEDLDELERSLYFGLGVGRSSLDPYTDEIPGVDVSEGKQTGAQLTLGLDVNRWFSLELHGADLGRAELSDNTSIGYREYGLSALVYLGDDRDRFNRRGWTVFGRTGAGHLSNTASEGVRFKQNEGLHWILGAGAEFSTRSGFALRAEGIAFDTDVSYLQLGLIYRIRRSTGWLSSLPGFTPSGPALKEKQELMAGVVSRMPTPDDDDGDSILRRDDKCPDTPQGVAVGDNGCAVFNGVIDGLTFRSGSAELTESGLVVLESVASSLLQIPEARARVSAHTDSSGDADANMQLSRQRALAVARYLVQRGISKDRLEARAFGELRPIDTNTTAAGRRYNRRVEIDLIAE